MKRVALSILLVLSGVSGIASLLLMFVSFNELINPTRQPAVVIIDKDKNVTRIPGHTSYISPDNWIHDSLIYIVAPAITALVTFLLFRYCYRRLSGLSLR